MKKILLTQSKHALVDNKDYDYLCQWKWYCNNGYACRIVNHPSGNGKYRRERIWMHRLILETPKDMDTDHIDGNRANNQRANLRAASRSQNNRNMQVLKNKTNKYRGVHLDKRSKRWKAAISVNSKPIYLGYFSSEKEAALKYNEAAIKFSGDFSRLNEVKK